MRAVVQDRYGPPELLRGADIPPPTPAADEVLIRVRATSVHADVWHVVAGYPYLARILAGGLRRPKHRVPGIDLAGVVEQVGPEVEGFAVGDEVFGEVVRGSQWSNGGTMAEFCAAPVQRLAHKPAALSWEQAAAVPTSALIALQAVRAEADVEAGQRVLVNGAGGALGVYVVQLAKAAGATVTAVDTAAKGPALLALGADRVIDFESESLDAAGTQDVVIDVASTMTLAEIRAMVPEDGRYVQIGHDAYGRSGHPLLGGLLPILRLSALSVFFPQLPRLEALPTPDQPMQVIADLIESGDLQPVVDRVYPLAQVPAALRQLMSGSAIGRIVISV